MLGFVAPARREEGTGEKLEVPGPPTSSDQPQLVPAGELDQQLGAPLGMAGLEAGVGECDRRVGRDGAGVELLREVERLLCGRERQVDVAGGERCVGAVEEVPGEALGVVHQPRGCDRAVEHLAGLRHPASNPEAASEHGDDEREEIALSGRAADPQRALGVRPCRREVVEVELGRGEMRERVEPTAELVVRESVDERRRRRRNMPVPRPRDRPPRSRGHVRRAPLRSARWLSSSAAASTARLAQARIAS